MTLAQAINRKGCSSILKKDNVQDNERIGVDLNITTSRSRRDRNDQKPLALNNSKETRTVLGENLSP